MVPDQPNSRQSDAYGFLLRKWRVLSSIYDTPQATMVDARSVLSCLSSRLSASRKTLPKREHCIPTHCIFKILEEVE